MTVARKRATRNWFAVCAATATVGLAAGSSRGQGRPDIAWMAGGHNESVLSVAYTPDSQMLLSSGNDQTLKFWRLTDGMLTRTIAEMFPPARSIIVSPDGRWIVTRDRTAAHVRRTSDGAVIRSITHPVELRSMALSPDGQSLATGGDDGTVRLWRFSDGQLLRLFEGHTHHVYSVAFSPDGTLLASGSVDDTVILWRVADGARLRTLSGHTRTVLHVGFSPDGATLVSGGDDRLMNMWRVSDGSLVWTIEPHFYGVAKAEFSPDGAQLATVGEGGGLISIWQTSDGTHLRTLRGQARYASDVVWAPDGRTLASASRSSAVEWWRASGGTWPRATTHAP